VIVYEAESITMLMVADSSEPPCAVQDLACFASQVSMTNEVYFDTNNENKTIDCNLK